MSSTVCHIEYPSEDFASSQKFCEAMFGWEFRSFGEDMMVFSVDGNHIGGFSKKPRATGPMCPEVCYKVDDVDVKVEQAIALGGRVSAEKHPVPGVGFYASVLAPDGNEFGMVQFTS